MALAKDPARYGGRARAFDQGPQAGEILYASDFGNNYYDGWRAAHGGFFMTPPCGLTAYPTHSSKLALQLSTDTVAYAVGDQNVQCSTFRSLSLYGSRRYLSYSAFLAAGVGQYTQSLAAFGMMLDIQKFDDSSRSFPWLTIQAGPSPTFYKMRINNDAAAKVDVPGTANLWPGDNENKQNFGYLRLTWDLQANGGLGGYHEAQIGNQVFDLTGLAGGSANTDPQVYATGGANATIEEYNGGLNMGLYVIRDTSGTTNGIATLVADSIVLSTHD